ncbi:MAG: asparagine synthase (glutamine-hydrolyzing) [Hyphomonadaceae bacterium]|nr:asparagine synthase (glutamine-hydrolyzing) [Clostridia bacterium]
MCGIVGWVDFENDLRDKKDIMQAMMQTLTHRGPDDEGMYVMPQVLLGHRRLVVVDPSGGKQPMQRDYDRNTYTMVYNGELYNTDELRAILTGRGHTFRSHSDTEVLLTAYMEWGVHCVDYLNGIYAFAVWDENQHSLFLARDRMGVKPCFFIEQGESVLFASEIKALLAHPDIQPNIDDIGLMQIFGLGPARPNDSGVFKNIRELPPAHWLLVTPQRTITHEYWTLESHPHEHNVEETTEVIRGLFIDAVERQLVSDVPVCTFLSGGLDSSAISAVAANYYRKTGKGVLDTYSIDYEGNAQHFKPTDFQPDADSEWIGKVSEAIGSNHTDVLIDTPALVQALKDAVRANDLPGMADVDSSLLLFCNQVRKGATVALSGECADEIFGGYPWFRKPEMIGANTFPWSQAIVERHDLLAPAFKHLPLATYVYQQYTDTLKKVPRLTGEDQHTHRMREISYLNLKWFMLTLLSRKDRMSMSNSLEVRVPFADHRIVEYAWNIPLAMKYLEGREKGLLRTAFKGLLPNDVLWRKKSPYPKTHNPAYLQAVQAWLGEILADNSSPILQIIDKAKVEEIVRTGGQSFGKPWFGQLMTGPQLIAYLAQMNEWMKVYGVRVV